MAVVVMHQVAMVDTIIGINMAADIQIQIWEMVETGIIKVDIIQEEDLH